MILCKAEHAKKIDSAVFPGQQGGPLEHVIAAKAVALKIAASELFAERQRRTIAGAQALAEQLCKRRPRRQRAHRRHRRAPDRSSTCATAARAERPAGRGSPARDRHHRQPQRGAVRPAPADGGLRPADRHAGAGHARPAASRTSSRSAQIIAAALTPRVRGPQRRARRARAAIVERYPLYQELTVPVPRSTCTKPGRPPNLSSTGKRRPSLLRVAYDVSACDAVRELMPHLTELDALLRLPGRGGRDRAADAVTMRFATAVGAIDEPRERGLSDRATPLLGGLGDLRRRAGRGSDLAAGRLRQRAHLWHGVLIAAGADHAGRGARRSLRPAAGGEAAGPDRRRLIVVHFGVVVHAITLPFLGRLTFPNAGARRGADGRRAGRR